MRTTADRLREQRERIGLSLVDVAGLAETTPQYLWKLEKGENAPPTWPLLVRLARCYGCSVDYLLGATDDPLARVGAPVSGEVVALMERITALPAPTMTMAFEVLAVIARHEAARQVAMEEEWNALRELIEKMTDAASVDVITAQLRDGEGISSAELLRLAQSVYQNKVGDAT